MNCQEYREIVSAHVDGALSAEETTEVQSHLEQCDPCTRMFHWEVNASKAIKEKLSAVTIDPAVRNRILQTLEKNTRRPLSGWSFSQFRLAASLAIVLVGIASVLVLRTGSSNDIFANVVAQHQKLVEGSVTFSDQPLRQAPDSPLDLSPWGYRLLTQQPAQYDRIKGTTFLYAGAGNEYVLAQEFKGGTLSAPAGAKSIEASGNTFIAHSREGVNLVAWVEKGVLCILASRLPQETLLQVATGLAAAG
jgi:hypothetical protein